MSEKENRLAKIDDGSIKSNDKREITPYDHKKLQINYKDHGRFVKVYNEPVNLPGKKILPNRNIQKISKEYGISSMTSISECDKFFKELANENSSYKEKFKVIILPKEPPVESSLYTKLSQKPWTTIGKLWGNLASVGSSVALSLLNYKKELKKRKDLQLYQVKLKNPRNIADQIQLDNLNIELEKIKGDEEDNNG